MGACYLVQLLCVSVYMIIIPNMCIAFYIMWYHFCMCAFGGETEIARREANGVALFTIKVTFDVMSHMEDNKHTQNKCNYKIFMQLCNEYTL